MKLKTITTAGGARFTVDADYADKFLGLANDLEASGYPIKGEQSGGYNDRNIDGTNTKSNHAYGRAIDINWTDNARGKRGTIPEELARNLADKYGMTWGGGWNNRDDMHFEIPGGNHTHGTQVAAAPSATPAPSSDAANPQVDSIVAAVFGKPTAEAVTPAPGGLKTPFGFGIGGTDKAPTGPDIKMQDLLGQPQVQKPLDLSRLQSVIAQRAKLGFNGGGFA
ncbi:MAG: M15 family metallopeptidase [Pirellulales bacterium]